MPPLRVAFGIAVLALSPAAGHAIESLPLVVEESFDQGLRGWRALDPATWRAARDGGLSIVEITSRDSLYSPPQRSPLHVALWDARRLADVDLEVRVKHLDDTGDHRDCCLFFGYQDAAHFYYVHFGAKPDPRAGQVMIVDGADRRPITRNERPVPWTDGWHTARVTRDLASGAIRVYFDGAPLMEARDTTFGAGLVGIGSFDDRCAFDRVTVRGR
ncbi:MAG: hypothetical protein ACRCT8_09005 [Lacipirellulaceae bacterium]